MKIKKLIAMVLAVFLLVGTLSACKASDKTDAPQTESAQDSEALKETENTKASESTEDSSSQTTPSISTELDELETAPSETISEQEVESTVVIDPTTATEEITDYEAYIGMNAKEQKAFFESFSSADDFFAWYNSAKAEYEENHPDIIIDGDTVIDFGG